MSDLTLTLQRNPFVDLEKFFARLNRPGGAEVRKVGDAIRQGFQESFTTESSAGEPWPELAGITQVQRQREGYAAAHPMLVRRGVLRSSWVERGAPNHYEQWQSTSDGWTLESGSDDERARLHEFGGNTVIQGRQVYVPPRPVGILSDVAEQRVVSVLEFVITEAQRATVGA